MSKPLLPRPDGQTPPAIYAWAIKLIQQLNTFYEQGTAEVVGTVKFYTGDTVPVGWLELDGSVIAEAAYPKLGAWLGTRYNTGGEGAGNFRLPSAPSADSYWIIKI